MNIGQARNNAGCTTDRQRRESYPAADDCGGRRRGNVHGPGDGSDQGSLATQWI